MINTEVLAITYGLGSAIAWGAGDFSGGVASKNNKVMTVILYSQIIGLVSLVSAQLFFAEKAPAPAHLVWGGLAGLCGAVGMVALYRGLAMGRMGVVAPVSAVVTAIIPVIVAFFTEGLPKTTQLYGFLGALAAVWLFSSGQGRIKLIKTELGLSLLAGIGFSLFFVCIDRVSSEAILWPLLAARVVSITFTTVFLAARGQLSVPPRAHLPAMAMAGLLDAAGNIFFALASQLGRLDVSAILASMYPASTVLLARCFLKESLSIQQRFGLLAACGALALIAI